MHYCCVLFVLSDLDFGTLVQLMSCVDFWLRVRVGGCHLSSDLLCFSALPVLCLLPSLAEKLGGKLTTSSNGDL